MLKLVKCELIKMKRKHFVSFIIFASVLFPIPLTILAVRGGFGSINSFDGLFQMLISYAEPVMLPCVLGIVASMLFIMERDSDTLKNLRVIPISAGSIATAKILVLFILGFIYSIITTLSAMVGGIISGGIITGILTKLSIAAITGLLYTVGTLPIVIAIVLFNKSYIFSIILTIFYTFFNFGLAFAGLGIQTPLMKILISIMPTPTIYRWQASVFVDNTASYYDIIKPYFLSLPVVVIVVGILGALSYFAILKIYKNHER